MMKNLSLFALAAAVTNVDAAAFANLKRQILNGKIHADGSLRGSGHRKLDEHLMEGCSVTSVVIRGSDLFNEAYTFVSYNTSNPMPGDFDLHNLPLIDPEPYTANGTVNILGYVNEQVRYLPDGPITPDDADYEPECHGVETWTFWDDSGVVTGQVSDQFSCRGFTQTIITGGTHDYLCAEGNVVKTFLTDDFYEGSGYVMFDIQNCGLCDGPTILGTAVGKSP